MGTWQSVDTFDSTFSHMQKVKGKKDERQKNKCREQENALGWTTAHVGGGGERYPGYGADGRRDPAAATAATAASTATAAAWVCPLPGPGRRRRPRQVQRLLSPGGPRGDHRATAPEPSF